MRLTLAAGSLILAGVALTACSSGPMGGTATDPAPTRPTSTAPVTPTSTAPTTPATSSSKPSPTPTRSTSTALAQPRSTCTSLGIRVIRGSGVTGREFAAVQFTNTGSSACVLNGYPTVTLLSGSGDQLGSQSQPAGNDTSTYRLAPGDTAESTLNDYVMNCNADLSDAVQVVAPGSDIHYSRPEFRLRACTLRTGPLGAPE